MLMVSVGTMEEEEEVIDKRVSFWTGNTWRLNHGTGGKGDEEEHSVKAEERKKCEN